MDSQGREKFLWMIVVLFMAVIVSGWIFSFKYITSSNQKDSGDTFIKIKQQIASEIPKFKQIISGLKEKAAILVQSDQAEEDRPTLTQDQLEYMKNRIKDLNKQ